MGAFDDLIPGEKNAVGFDDLIPKQTKSPRISDYAKQLASGALSGTGMVFQGGGDILARGINNIGEGLGYKPELRAVNPLNPAIESLQEGLSPEAKQRIADSNPEGDISKPETWSAGKNPSISGYALQGANVLGQFAPNLALGVATGGASIPVQVGAGAAMGGVQAYGGALDEERSRFMGMSDAELRKNTTLYADLVDKKGMKPEAAKAEVADRAAIGGGVGNAIPSALEGGVENALIGAFTKGKLKIPALFGKGLPGTIATGVLGGAATGGTEESVEQASQNLAANLAVGGNRSAGENTFNQFVLGAIGEGAVGGGGAVAQHFINPPVKTETPTAESSPPQDAYTGTEQPTINVPPDGFTPATPDELSAFQQSEGRDVEFRRAQMQANQQKQHELDGVTQARAVDRGALPDQQLAAAQAATDETPTGMGNAFARAQAIHAAKAAIGADKPDAGPLVKAAGISLDTPEAFQQAPAQPGQDRVAALLSLSERARVAGDEAKAKQFEKMAMSEPKKGESLKFIEQVVSNLEKKNGTTPVLGNTGLANGSVPGVSDNGAGNNATGVSGNDNGRDGSGSVAGIAGSPVSSIGNDRAIPSGSNEAVAQVNGPSGEPTMGNPSARTSTNSATQPAPQEKIKLNGLGLPIGETVGGNEKVTVADLRKYDLVTIDGKVAQVMSDPKLSDDGKITLNLDHQYGRNNYDFPSSGLVTRRIRIPATPIPETVTRTPAGPIQSKQPFPLTKDAAERIAKQFTAQGTPTFAVPHPTVEGKYTTSDTKTEKVVSDKPETAAKANADVAENNSPATKFQGDSGLGNVTIKPIQTIIKPIAKILAAENAAQVSVTGGNSDVLRQIAKRFGKSIVYFRPNLGEVRSQEEGLRLQPGRDGATSDAGRNGEGGGVSDAQRIDGGRSGAGRAGIGESGVLTETRGFVNPAHPNLIFLNVDSSNHLLYILGHEFGHTLRLDDPKLWAQMAKNLQPLIKNWSQYKSGMVTAFADETANAEELFGDMIGDNFLNESFWSELAQQDKTLFQKIASAVVKLLNKALSLMVGKDVSTYVTDMKQARAIISSVMAQYADNASKGMYGVYAKQLDQDYINKRMVAWHGSPHDHDKFDSSKIGTGEGNASYGHGIYFASNREVAKWYKDMLTPMPRGVPAHSTLDGKRITAQIISGIAWKNARLDSGPMALFLYFNRDKILKGADAKTLLAAEIDSAKNDLSRIQKRIDDRLSHPVVAATYSIEQYRDQEASAKQYLKEKEALMPRLGFVERVEGKPKGRLYQVELAPAADEYLDWDRPLSEQSEKVKAALATMGVDVGDKRGTVEQRDGGWAAIDSNGKEIAVFDYKSQAESEINGIEKTGKEIYRELSGGNPIGHNAKMASQFLHDAGIRGIRYLDGSSRGQAYEVVLSTSKGEYSRSQFDSKQSADRYAEEKRGEGFTAKVQNNESANSNFVIFDDADVSITNKYSKSSSPSKSQYGDINSDQEAASKSVPEETSLQAKQRVVQDQFNRFKVLQDWVKTQGMNLSEAADVYLAETLMSGRISTRKQDFRENQMGPLIQKTQKAGISMEQVGDFLKAQHAPEANQRARDIHHSQDATAFGMTDQEARDAMAEFKKLPNFAQLKEVSNEWRGITEQTKKILLDAGILSDVMVAAWENTYSQYVPVKGMEDKPGGGTGKGLNVNGKQKRRLGHELRDEGIIENILHDHERAISLDEKNLVGQALIRFALEAKNDDIITVSKPVKRQVLKNGQTSYMATYHGADVAAFDNPNEARQYVAEESLKNGRNKADYDVIKTTDPVRVMLQASPMLADNEVNVYVAGHSVRVQINDEIAARAYTRMGVEHLNAILAAGREANNWLSKAYTGYSPDFIFTNPLRDATQGLITLTGNYGAGMAGKVFANYPQAVKELVKHFRNPGSSALVTDYRANGGSTGAAYLSDLERIGDDIQASYNEYAGVVDTYHRTYAKAVSEGKGIAKARFLATLKSSAAGLREIPVIGHFLSMMEHVNAITENALRVATYHTLVQNGISKPRAAAQAKNLMNFNRKGEIANQAGAMYLFFNPNVQGAQVMYQALMESEHKTQARALSGMMVLSAIVLAEMAMGGGDDDEEKWKNTPDYVKDGNLIIGFGDYQFMLTLPYGYRVFHTLGNVMSDFAHGENGYKLGIRLASSIFANFSPIGNPMEGEHQPFQLLPTIPKMVLGPSMNETSLGGAITPKRWNDAKPDSQLMNRATKGTTYAGVAEGLNALTGGSKYESGMVDVSPETLKYWVRSLTGGAGQFALDATNIAAQASQGVAPQSPKDIPIVRRFLRESGVSDTRAAFWERANEARKAADEFSEARKNRDSEAARDIWQDKGPLIALSHYADSQQKMIKARRDEIDRIRNSDSLSLDQKMNQMKLLETQESAVYSRFIRQFDQRVAAQKAAAK